MTKAPAPHYFGSAGFDDWGYDRNGHYNRAYDHRPVNEAYPFEPCQECLGGKPCATAPPTGLSDTVLDFNCFSCKRPVGYSEIICSVCAGHPKDCRGICCVPLDVI